MKNEIELASDIAKAVSKQFDSWTHSWISFPNQYKTKALELAIQSTDDSLEEIINRAIEFEKYLRSNPIEP